MPPPLILTAEGLAKAYGAAPLFRDLSFTLHEGDRVGLVGPNGAGKSTLLRILAGREEPDHGRLAPRRGLRVGVVEQVPTFDPGASIESIVEGGLGPSVSQAERQHRVGRALGRTGFEDPSRGWETLSGGWRRRVALAREVARGPDLLLLDEPTNHLDVEGILWLEDFLASEPEAFVTVSHDRRFLQNTVRRIFDLDPRHPGGILRVEGSWEELLVARAEEEDRRATAERSLANRARRELEWLRRGPKARTTKANARIDAAGRLFDDLDDVRRRGRDRTVGLEIQGTDRRTKRLWEGKGLSRSRGDLRVLREVDLLLRPGHRIGVVGANGTGKTTLLKLIVGELEPDSGEIRTADELRIAYFAQERDTLDPRSTLRRALAPGGDSVVLAGREIHVAAWAARFLFRPEQLEAPIDSLSGGERARVLLSRVMLRPADVLVLDEPTNDLDIPTLEVLEETLLEFPGALVLVTHDRYLMDRVCTSVLALDGRGGVVPFADFDQWRAAVAAAEAEERAAARAAQAAARPEPPERPRERKKLSYLEQREWDGMEERILEAEGRREEALAAVEDPAVATDAVELQRRADDLAAADAEIEALMTRWAELEEKQG